MLSTLGDDSLLKPILAGGAAVEPEPWVTAEQVAHHLGVVKDTVYRWREQRNLPAHRVGRLWKFQISEVNKWVRAGGPDTLSAEKEDRS
ncbi:helix-turn-helix domain-containing protein [Sulfitobacter sp.]|uniref:helix-turn-helix domain-containing protein n=1 Tax=Sulfitobacter sp. TaxID=1903071 RepID=UPI004058F594